MEILFIYLGCLIFGANSYMPHCVDFKIQPIVHCNDYLSNCYILEGDEEDYQKLQHIDTQIIKPSFIIPQQEQPVVIRIINSFDEKKKISEKLMCSLFRKLEYSIVCISVELVYQEEQINFSEKLRFDTKIQATELCDEMDTNEDGSLNIFCLNQFSLKQYTLNISSRNATLIFEHDLPDQIQDSCKIKYVKWNQNQYIVAFYQCSRWKILLIKNNEVTTLLEAQMNDKDTLFQGLSYINDVSFCTYQRLIVNIYLIENNSYLQVSMNHNQKLFQYQFSFENIKRIQKIIVQQKCSLIIVFNPLQDDNSNAINPSQYKEISLNQKYSNHIIYFHSDILFLQNSTELVAFLNSHLNQTFQIKSTPLYFFEIDKLFCQFDQQKNALQFYRYYQLSSFIKPKLKYLYIIQTTDLFRINTLLLCLRIVYENNTQEEKSQLIQQITVQHQCQSKLQQTINKSKVQNGFKNSSFNLYNSEGNISVSIRNNHIFLDSCLTKLQQFHFKTKIELRQLNIPDYIIFKNGTFFYIYSCKQNKLLIQININQFEVLETKDNYFIVNKNTSNLLRIIQFKEEQLFQYKIQFDDVIISAQQFSKSIFLYINNSNQPPLIFNNFQQKLDRKYLPKGLYQSEPILFYQEVGNKQFIQYLNIIAVENKGNIRYYKFQEGLIISVQNSKLTSQDFSIVAIQNVTSSLILTYFNDHELLQISNYTFSDYQFFYPFKYNINLQYLAILMNKNKDLYIAIFEYTLSSLELLEIIRTDDSFFTFYQNNLLFTFNNEWRHLLLREIFVEVETNSNFQYNLSSLYYLTSTKQEDKDIQLKFQIQNNCYKLHALKNLSIFEIQQNQILNFNIYDIFYGPINSLKLVTNSSIILNGPFQLRKELQLCNLNGSYFCIKQYKIEVELMFSIIILENQVFEITIQSQSTIIYITYIKLTYYLWFLLKDTHLKIQLIQCSDENINVIQDLNDNFKIKHINQADIIRTGNLIHIKNQNIQTYIYFEDTQAIQIKIPGNVLDIIYIEDSQDQYLTLQQKTLAQINYDLIIYSINLNQNNLLYSISIFKELQIEVTNRQIPIEELKLISCINIGSFTKIKLFIISDYYSYLYQLILDQQKNYIKFELQKQIRNSFSFNSKYEKIQIEQFNEDILVLKIIKTNQFQYYDLREERNFYDYFYKSSNLIKIKQINTTHSIFIIDSFVYLGTIGYEIELQNGSEINYNFELHAQNDISDEKVSFLIHIIKQNHQFTKTNILIQFSSFIFIIIYLRNRQYMIQKQQKRKKNLQVIQIRDI